MIISKGLGSNIMGISGINSPLEITMPAQKIKLTEKSFDTNKAPVQNNEQGLCLELLAGLEPATC